MNHHTKEATGLLQHYTDVLQFLTLQYNSQGHFSISWASYADDGLTHQQVALIPDTGLPPLHLYVQTVPTPPALNNPTKVLQVSVARYQIHFNTKTLSLK